MVAPDLAHYMAVYREQGVAARHPQREQLRDDDRGQHPTETSFHFGKEGGSEAVPAGDENIVRLNAIHPRVFRLGG